MNHPVQILLQSSSTVTTCLIKDHTIDMYEGMEVQFLALVNLNATRGDQFCTLATSSLEKNLNTL